MKESLSEIVFILKSRFSPLGATVIVPDEGTKVEFEDLENRSSFERTQINEDGEVIIPTGSSTRVTFKIKGREFNLKVDDYKERTGHTPGTKISGALKFKLNTERARQIVPGYGTFSYEKE